MKENYGVAGLEGYDYGKGGVAVTWKAGKGAPHTSVYGSKGRASICFFGRHRIWRVFWLWPESKQKYADFGDANLALAQALRIVGVSNKTLKEVFDDKREYDQAIFGRSSIPAKDRG